MYLPKKVAELIEDIRKNIDTEPLVDRVGDRRFRITIANDRVHCTVDYRFTGNRWDWADSKLTVDGKRIDIMPSPAAFYRLYREPDSYGLKQADMSILDELTPVELTGPEAAFFSGILEYVQGRIAPVDPTAVVQFNYYRKEPVMVVKMERSTMIWGTGAGAPSWKLIFIQLDGWDFTDRFKGKDLETVFGFLAESHGVTLSAPPTNTPNQFGTSQPKSISNAVRTRKQTVIRT